MGTTSSYTNSGAPQTDDELLGVRSGSTVNLWGASYVPATASDAGTDAFQFDAGRDVADTEVVPVNIGSANTTTTPTLENTGGTPAAQTITTKDGSALWAGALDGDHHFKRNGSTSWLVLDPIPVIPGSTTKTGADGKVVSGTAGADGNLAQWNADGDAVDSGVASSEVSTLSLKTPVDATNGGANDRTEIDYTGIAAGTNRITILVESLSLTGSDQVLVQLGDSGGFETSGYTSLSAALASGSTNVVTGTSGFVVRLGSASVVIAGGEIVLTRISGNKWVCAHNLSRSDSDVALTGSGVKELSAELDRVRVASSGSDTFDGGNVNILVE